MLMSSFSRPSTNGGGSGIFLRNFLHNKDADYLKRLGCENTFELSAVEPLDFNFIPLYMYRSTDANFYEILYKLESVICKAKSRGKCMLLFGDLNINFLQHSVKLFELQNLLLTYNLKNKVKCPTRITQNTCSLIDVTVTNLNSEKQTTHCLLAGSG